MISDLTRGDEGVLVYRPGASQIVRGEGEPETSGPASRGPLAFAGALIASGHLVPAGTRERDGRTVEVFEGDPVTFVLAIDDPASARAASARFTSRPSSARLRYLREATGAPVLITVPGGTLRPEGSDRALRLPAQRFTVTAIRTSSPTDEALAVFDLTRAYPGLTAPDQYQARMRSPAATGTSMRFSGGANGQLQAGS